MQVFGLCISHFCMFSDNHFLKMHVFGPFCAFTSKMPPINSKSGPRLYYYQEESKIHVDKSTDRWQINI